MSTTRAILIGLGILILVTVVGTGLGWFGRANNLAQNQVFAPREADVQREVYTHTRSYRSGSIQRLGTLCIQADQANQNHRQLINSQIVDEFSDWDAADVPAHLRPCLDAARGN